MTEQDNTINLLESGKPWLLVIDGDDYAVLRSSMTEKYIVADTLEELEKLSDGYAFRADVQEALNAKIQQGKQKLYDHYDEAVAEMQTRTLNRNTSETEAERAYRRYLNGVRKQFEANGEIGDWREYANDKQTFLQEYQEVTAAPKPEIKEEKEPIEDIHKSYHNDKLYEKNTPLNLRERKQFVCWKYEFNGERWGKIPYNPNNGMRASSTTPRTWSDFDTACKAVDKYGLDGVGIIFTKGLVGIDIDHCIVDGKISERAKDVVDTVNSYTELSPSGTGIHILAFGKFDGTRTRRDEFEMYQKGRFFTLTGKPFENKFRKIPKAEAVQEALNTVYTKYVNIPVQPTAEKPQAQAVAQQPLTLDDEKIISLCQKSKNASRFNRLWQGDTSLYKHDDGTPDHSISDGVLVGMLAYYTQDRTQIDRIFRKSGLYRDKWDKLRGEKTYGEMTIDNALQSAKGNTYNPNWYYENKVKPELAKKRQQRETAMNSSDWTTITIPKDSKIGENAKVNQFALPTGDINGTFSYNKTMTKQTDNGYRLRVNNSFMFRIRTDEAGKGFDLTVSELRRAFAGESVKQMLKEKQEQKQQQYQTKIQLEQ